MPEPVDQILQRFPGRVTFPASRTKWMFFLLGSVLLLMAALYLPTTRTPTWMVWLLIGLCGLGIPISIVGMFFKPSQLTLDAKGFKFGAWYLVGPIGWSEAANFRAARSGGNNIFGFQFGGVKVVEFDYVGQKTGGTLFDTYGFSNEDLARLMNAWRERALR